MSDSEFREGGDRGLGDHDPDDRARERQIRMWRVVGGAVLLAAVVVVIAIGLGRDGADDTMARPTSTPTASETTPTASETPVPPVQGTPVPTASLPPGPSATPTSSPTPVAPPTAGQQETTDVFTPRLVWEPSTSAIEGAAVMGSIVEQGGSCTIVAQRGGETVESAAFAAQADAQSTVCGGLALSSERLTAGDWAVHVHYESPDAIGDSEVTTVTVG